jgi:hypothetical protein
VWIYRNGIAPFRKEALTEVLNRIEAFEKPDLGPEVLKVTVAAKRKVEEILAAGGPPARPARGSSGRFPVGPSNTVALPQVWMTPRPKALARVTVEGTVVDSEGKPLAGAMVSARGASPAVRTDARGTFALSGVDAGPGLFVRVSMKGYATTNTSYLNPWGAKENLRILTLRKEQVAAMLASWGAGSRGGDARVVLAFDSLGDNGEAIAGLELSARRRGSGAWPANIPQFGYADSSGGFSGKASTKSRKEGVQILGLASVEFQPCEPPIPNVYEPNTIVSVSPFGTALTFPAFAGQVSYAVIRGPNNSGARASVR